jgi:S-adenosyl methyltransferase
MATAASQLNRQMGSTRITPRTRDQIARCFNGTDLLEPGLVHLPPWRATADPGFVIACLAGVGRKR